MPKRLRNFRVPRDKAIQKEHGYFHVPRDKAVQKEHGKFRIPRDKADQKEHGTGPSVNVDKLVHGNVQIFAQ